MKKFRVYVFFGNESYHRTVEAKTNLEAIIKTQDEFNAKKDKREYWPMRAIEL